MDSNISKTINYSVNGVLYSVETTMEQHEQIEEDPRSFIETVFGSIENVAAENSDDVNFSWSVNRKAVRLLVDQYKCRMEKFRDPKIPKKKLWNEIVEIFKDHGYNQLTRGDLDLKFRNLKKTYRTIKENNMKKKGGRGKITWEYWEDFEEIYKDDEREIRNTTKSFNQSRIIIKPKLKPEYVNIKRSSLLKAVPISFEAVSSTPQSFNQSPMVVKHELQAEDVKVKRSSGSTLLKTVPVSFNTLTGTLLPLNQSSIVIKHELQPEYVDVQESSEPTLLEEADVLEMPRNTKTPNRRRAGSLPRSSGSAQAIQSRNLYNLGKRQLEMEEKKLEELVRIREAIEENNRIQEDRNLILRELVNSRNNSD